jgi:hypothetical protein
MKSQKQIKKQIKQYEAKLKSGTLKDHEADKMLSELEVMINQLEQVINISVNKLKNKL